MELFGRVVDRSRQLVEEMEKTHGDAALNTIRVRQVERLWRRAGMLIRAQTCFYAALGLFVAAALVSVVGAAMASGHPIGYRAAAITGMLVGGGAATGLFAGCARRRPAPAPAREPSAPPVV